MAYCVPLVAVHDTDFENHNYAYPSASASYSYSYPVAEDDDFCDIIADLAQAEYDDVFLAEPSAVALPVDESDQDSVPAVSIAVSKVCVATYTTKGFEILPAKAVDADEFFEECLKCENVENHKEVLNDKLACEKKVRRLNAVLRLKEKRHIKKQKQALKSIETNQTAHPTKYHTVSTVGLTTSIKMQDKVPAISARQIAAASRERVKGKFKNNNTRWVSVTEFLRRTHIDANKLTDNCETQDTSGLGQHGGSTFKG